MRHDMMHKPHLRVISGGMNKSDPVERWATWMRAQSWSQRTISDRLALVRKVASSSHVDPISITHDHVLAYLSRPEITGASRQTYYNSLRAWFRWANSQGLCADEMADMPKPRAGRQQRRHLTTAHVEALLASRMRARTRTMILLAAYQGLRAFEIAKIRGTDVDLISGELEVVGKGDTHAILPLHPLVAAEARQYGQDWWFPQWKPNHQSEAGGHILGASVTSIVSVAMKRAGIPGSCHSLRHWHATELLRSGVDSRVTQQLMRHASLATTQQYMHVDDTQRREALERLPDVTRPSLEIAA